MKSYFFIFLITFLCIIQNAVESKKSKQKMVRPPYPVKPDFIKYYVSKELNAQNITDFIEFFEHVSCLQFKRQNTTVKAIGINFYPSRKLSKVVLSTSPKKPTEVYLIKKIFNNSRKLSFYIGLALGLIPEIRRFDRERNVEVFFKNIAISKKHYYKKKGYDEKFIGDTGFDFSSVMLVDPYFGSKNRKRTYKSTLSPYYDKIFDVFKTYSYNDYKRVNHLHCGHVCSKKNDCNNGGYYVDSCEVCTCPFGFRGRKCNRIQRNNGNCSISKQNFMASPSEKTLLLSNISSFCVYSIKSKNEKKVKVTVVNLKLSKINSCDKGTGVEIKHGQDKGADGLYLCENYKNIEIPPLSSEVHIRFSDYTPNNMLKLSYQEVN